MSSRIATRTALRQAKSAIQRRAASSTTEAVQAGASQAKQATQEVASKAQQGLSKVTSSAGAVAGSAASAASNTASNVGGRTGQIVGFVQGLIPPTVYYARVVGELGKMIVQGRGMNPPSMQTIQPYLNSVQSAISKPSTLMSTTQQAATSAANSAASAVNNPQSFISRLRNLDAATLTTVGVVGAEAIGFFTIGEMIGRFKLVGYHGNPHPEH